MDAVCLTIVALFAFGASFTQRVTGFGFGIFIMTILPHIMPSYGEATALSGLLALVNVTSTGIKMRRHIQWHKVLVIVSVFVVVSFFCVRAVSLIDSHVLKHYLGGFLVLVSIYFLLVSGRIRLKPSMPVQATMGALSGMMGGFFAMQGPPAVIYFLSCTDTKEQYISLISIYFIISNTMMTIFRAANGFVTATVLECVLIGVPAVILGALVGSKVYDRIKVETLRRIIYAFMAVSGIIALIS